MANLTQSLERRIELVRHDVDRGPITDPEIRIRGRRLPEQAFQVKPGVCEARRRIGNKIGILWM